MTHENLFKTHMLNVIGISKCQAIGELYKKFLEDLSEHIIDGREAAIARTNLESACFYSKKSVANDPANQK